MSWYGKYSVDCEWYETLRMSLKERLHRTQKVRQDTEKGLVDTFCWVLTSKFIIRKKNEWWLEKCGISSDRAKGIDYFLEILQYIDDEELLLYFNEWENNSIKIGEFCDKYIFIPWRGKVTSLYAEMKKRGLLDQSFIGPDFDQFQEEEKCNPYEKCDIDTVYDFIHWKEDLGRGLNDEIDESE